MIKYKIHQLMGKLMGFIPEFYALLKWDFFVIPDETRYGIAPKYLTIRDAMRQKSAIDNHGNHLHEDNYH